MTTDQSEWVLERVRERCDPDGSGRNATDGDLWTSKAGIEYAAGKSTTPVDAEGVRDTIETLVEDGSLFDWNGLLVPNEEPFLRAVAHEEATADECVRRLLIGKSNTELSA